MWAQFVVGSRPCSEGFSPGTVSGFPPSRKTNISKFKFDLETVDKEPLCGCATQIPVYLFAYFMFYCVRRSKDAVLIQIGVEIEWDIVY